MPQDSSHEPPPLPDANRAGPVDEVFEHYRIFRRPDGALWELGHGAMGVTYKAVDTNLDKPVALKIINSQSFSKESARKRFRREARSAASLHHRHVASVFHLGESGGNFFYAMEFIDGETIDALVKREGPLPWRTVFAIAIQVARALMAAHAKGLVHRDIKPSNIMVVDEVDERGVVKLIDFGLAKSAEQEEGSLDITNVSGFLGTPLYASPEQCEEIPADIRSDIYSLGVTLWYMLTGQPTFVGTLGRVLQQQMHAEPPWERLPADLPPGVPTVLRRMLAKDRERRPQTPADLRTEIEACLQDPGVHVPEMRTGLAKTASGGGAAAAASKPGTVGSPLVGTARGGPAVPWTPVAGSAGSAGSAGKIGNVGSKAGQASGPAAAVSPGTARPPAGSMPLTGEQSSGEETLDESAAVPVPPRGPSAPSEWRQKKRLIAATLAVGLAIIVVSQDKSDTSRKAGRSRSKSQKAETAAVDKEDEDETDTDRTDHATPGKLTSFLQAHGLGPEKLAKLKEVGWAGLAAAVRNVQANPNIPPAERADALSGIAVGQAKLGDAAGSQGTFALASQAVDGMADGDEKTAARKALADKLAEVKDKLSAPPPVPPVPPAAPAPSGNPAPAPTPN